MAKIYDFNSRYAEQTVTLPRGKYLLECWGAAGGGGSSIADSNLRSKGGYSKGELTLKKETTLHVYVGYSGRDSLGSTPFNGGGKAEMHESDSDKNLVYCNGGGATDIRLVGGSWDNEQGLLSRIIVAGGGGRNDFSNKGGDGGGVAGGSTKLGEGGTEYKGGKGASGTDGSFGKGGKGIREDQYKMHGGGGGGWYGGGSGPTGGGGSGYVLTENSYKPAGYTPTSEYWLENTSMTVGGGIAGGDGKAKITLLQGLPFLVISSYTSQQAIFTAGHTEENKLSKIECFIDDALKETFTTDLYLEKTINYTLEDNALHTLKIVATDAEGATAEKILSISKEIMPLQSDATLQDISSKLVEIGERFRNGKTSIINTLALKNIEASLNNTLVELSEKIKTSFDSGDASVQDLMNQLTQANNTINQLNSKYKYASGTVYQRENTLLYACLYDPNSSHSDKIVRPDYWFDFNGIGFIPDLFFAELDYQPNSDKIFKYFVFVVRNIPSISNNSGFVVNIIFNKTYGQTTFSIIGELFALGKSHVYMNNNGIRVPVPYSLSNSPYNWHAIKFA
ncbi:glycine rich domain-containing protein [Clostridioides difficile]|uniref:glycine rich domain-containing protein n=1 Tax=Clostridioides difficile TaxID=1496 RepID=UPI0020C4F22A|nr:glycine rich domain-containing protein [Clostridioides difficile]MCP8368341.1 glycine rich domain-containing protein [Clostridioides difficile]